ncbi:hypothetical protein V8C86DRAFT_643232 [Haematococcus lacustris]
MGDADLSLVPLAARDGVLGRAQKRAAPGSLPSHSPPSPVPFAHSHLTRELPNSMPAPPMPRGKQLLHCGNTELDPVKHQFTQAPTLAVPGTVTSPLVLYPPTASNSHPDLLPVHTQHMSPQHSHTFPTSPGQSPKFQGGRPWRASLDPGPHSPPPLQPAPHAASLRAAEQQTLPPLTWLRQALEGGGPVDLHGDASTAMGGIVPGMRASMPAAARLPGLMGAATSPGRKKRSNEAAVAELEELIGHMMQLPQQSWRASTGGLGMVSQAPPRPHGIARQSLLLKLPSAQDSRRLDLPAMVTDRFGHACLVVLPSDKPSTRAEALALEDLLVEVLREPVKAVHRAAAWRVSTLNSLCSEALMAVNEGLHGSHLGPRPLGQSWACRAAAEAPPGATPGPPAPSSVPVLLAGGEVSHAAMISQQAPGHLVQAIGSDTEAGGPGQELGAAVARAQGGSEAVAHLRVTSALGLAVATTVCMADAIRQVEVHCSERGRVMAYIWNAFLTSHEGALAALQGENAQLSAHNRQLREEVAELHNQVEGVDFLRKSCKAFRAEVERSAEEAGSLLKEVLEQRQVVEEVSQAFRQTEDLVSRQLARLRWQHALHLLGCRHRQPVLVSGGQGPKGSPAALPAKIALLSRLGAQVAHAQQRKRLHGVQQLWSQFEGKATLQELVKSALHASHQLPWTAASLTESPEQLLARLPALQIEAQVCSCWPA